MPDKFDPYHKWLGIPPKDQPPNHYRLLGIELFESDADVIATAVDQRMAHVKTFAAGAYSAESQQILNELATAKICLLNPEKKAEYDGALARARQAREVPPAQPQSTDPPSAWASAPSPEADFEFIHQPAKPSQKPPKANYLSAAITGACVVFAAILVLAFAFSRGGREVADGDPLKAKKNGAVELKVAPKTTPKVAGAKVDHKVGPMVEPKARPKVEPARPALPGTAAPTAKRPEPKGAAKGDVRAFQAFVAGKWRLAWSGPMAGREAVEIDGTGDYHTGNFHYQLEMLEFIPGKRVAFLKHFVGTDRPAERDELEISRDGRVMSGGGGPPAGLRLRYERAEDGREALGQRPEPEGESSLLASAAKPGIQAAPEGDQRAAEASKTASAGDASKIAGSRDPDIRDVRTWSVRIPCSRTDTKYHSEMTVSPRGGYRAVSVPHAVVVHFAEMGQIRATFVDYKGGRATLRYLDGQLPANKAVDYRKGIEYKFPDTAFADADKALLRWIKATSQKKNGDGLFELNALSRVGTEGVLTGEVKPVKVIDEQSALVHQVYHTDAGTISWDFTLRQPTKFLPETFYGLYKITKKDVMERSE